MNKQKCTLCSIEKELSEFYFEPTRNYRRKQCKDCIRGNRLKYYDNNKEACSKYNQIYQKKNRKSINSNIYNRMKSDIDFRISCNIRKRLWIALKSIGTNKDNKTMVYTGCDKDTLRLHLESLFTEGMSWDNYGEWHIDHIIPFKYYFLHGGLTEENLFKVMNYKNLQPLWRIDNLSKNAKWSS